MPPVGGFLRWGSLHLHHIHNNGGGLYRVALMPCLILYKNRVVQRILRARRCYGKA